MNDNMRIEGHDEFLVDLDDGHSPVRGIARNYSSAKYKAWLHNYSEWMSYDEFIKDKNIKIKVRKIRKATLSSLFMEDESLDYIRKYRNMPFVELGMKVMYKKKHVLYIIGGTNYIYCYNTINNEIESYHPKSEMTYYDENDNIIAEYND